MATPLMWWWSVWVLHIDFLVATTPPDLPLRSCWTSTIQMFLLIFESSWRPQNLLYVPEFKMTLLRGAGLGLCFVPQDRAETKPAGARKKVSGGWEEHVKGRGETEAAHGRQGEGEQGLKAWEAGRLEEGRGCRSSRGGGQAVPLALVPAQAPVWGWGQSSCLPPCSLMLNSMTRHLPYTILSGGGGTPHLGMK